MAELVNFWASVKLAMDPRSGPDFYSPDPIDRGACEGVRGVARVVPAQVRVKCRAAQARAPADLNDFSPGSDEAHAVSPHINSVVPQPQQHHHRINALAYQKRAPEHDC